MCISVGIISGHYPFQSRLQLKEQLLMEKIVKILFIHPKDLLIGSSVLWLNQCNLIGEK